MKMQLRLLSFVFSLALVSASAHANLPKVGCTLFPPNRLSYPVGAGNLAVTMQSFNAVLDRLEQVYQPIFHARGLMFRVERKWTDSTVNAYAWPQGSAAMVSMFGGLARHPGITADAFLLVACHEVGHHLGGAPLNNPDVDWKVSSVEGQADYYGSLKCMRLVLHGMDHAAILSKMKIDPIANQLCNANYPDRENVQICVRSMMAGKALATVLASLDNDGRVPMPQFNTPDGVTVTQTDTSHPPAQCRLDTYLQASLCLRNPQGFMNPDSIAPGTCDDGRMTFERFGHRPRCWFSPTDPRTLSSFGSGVGQ